MHSSLVCKKLKIVNNGVVSPYHSRSVVYDVVVSGSAAAECTLWEGV